MRFERVEHFPFGETRSVERANRSLDSTVFTRIMSLAKGKADHSE